MLLDTLRTYLNKRDFLKLSLLTLIILYASYLRYIVFDESGGDTPTYRKAVTDLLDLKNPYETTVATFRKVNPIIDLQNGVDHGYAYMPTLLYIYAPLYVIHKNFDLPLQRVWKPVVLFAELGVCFFLIKEFYKKDYLLAVFSVAIWMFNPYFMERHSFTYTDPLGIFFMLIALYFLEKNDKKAGVFYLLSLSFKAFPLILLPIFLLKVQNKFKFLIACFITFLILSLPFFYSLNDLTMYIKGAFLVHSTREVQGRPILAYITAYTGLPLFNVGLIRIYVWLSILTGWLVSTLLIFKRKILDKYILSAVNFFLFFLFTPVLARTYLLWFIPILILALHFKFSGRRRYLIYIVAGIFYAFYFWYLSQWNQGVRVVEGMVTF